MIMGECLVGMTIGPWGKGGRDDNGGMGEWLVRDDNWGIGE